MTESVVQTVVEFNMTLYRVDVLSDLLAFLTKREVNHEAFDSDVFSFFCPREHELRHAEVKMLANIRDGWGFSISTSVSPSPKQPQYRMFKVVCGNCRQQSIFILCITKLEDRLVMINPDFLEGDSSNVPKSVSYYLTQARKAHDVSANSAAVAMYRAALEQLLYQQGYVDGMLGKKINDLEQDIGKGNAPKWAVDLDREFLTFIKELGNTSIHPNDGDISKQNSLDSDLIAALEITFAEIIDRVYEAPSREAARKALLKSAIAQKP